MKRTLAVLLILAGVIVVTGGNKPAAQAQSQSAPATCQLHPTAYWSEEAVGRLNDNYPYYQISAVRKGADWKVLAVLHMMEHSLVMDNPANGQGFMQLYSYEKEHPNAFPEKTDLSREEVIVQLDLAYDHLQGKAGGKLTANPELDTLYQAAAAYNGLGYHKRWEDHPYVVNDPPNGVFLKKPGRDGGPEDTVSKQAGFKPLYEDLTSLCPTGAVLISPRLDSNREAVDRCNALAGPDLAFPLQTDAATVAGGSDKGDPASWLIWTPGPANQHHDYDAADIHVPTGTSVISMTAGEVVDVRAGAWKNGSWQPSRLRIQSADGCVLWYQHLLNGSVLVKKGQKVAAGTPIAQVGTPQDAMDTAPHLHIDVAASFEDSQAARSRKVCARDPQRCAALTFDIQPVVAKLYLTKLVSNGQVVPPSPKIAVDKDHIPELESLLSLPDHSRYMVLAGLLIGFVLVVSTRFAPKLAANSFVAALSRVDDKKAIGPAKSSNRSMEVLQPNDEIIAAAIEGTVEHNPLLPLWDRLYSGMHFFLMGAAPGLIGLGLATHPHWRFRGLPLGLVIPWQIIGMRRALMEIPFWFVLPLALIALFVAVYGFMLTMTAMNLVISLINKGGMWTAVRTFWSPRNQWRVAKTLKQFLPTLGLLELELVMLWWVMGVSTNSVWRIGWSIFLIAAPTVFHFHRQIFKFVGWLVALPVLLIVAVALKLMIRREVQAVTSTKGRHAASLLDTVVSRIAKPSVGAEGKSHQPKHRQSDSITAQ